MEEAVLQIRGGDGLTDIVGILAFIIFINWYDSLFGVKAFQVNPLPIHNASRIQHLDLNERHFIK